MERSDITGDDCPAVQVKYAECGIEDGVTMREKCALLARVYVKVTGL